MSLAVLDQPLPLFLIVQVFYFGLIFMFPLSASNDLPVAVLDDLLVLVRVVVLLRHHIVRTEAFRGC